ncbi:MAG: hypothetical protein ACOY0T_35560 [Myxococcota bacterium]
MTGMNLINVLIRERSEIERHLQTMDTLIERVAQLSSIASFTSPISTPSHAVSRQIASSSSTLNRLGTVKAAILEAAKEWVRPSALLACVDASAAATYKAISTMVRAGMLERRGELGHYEYRAKVPSVRAPINVGAPTSATYLALAAPRKRRNRRTLDERVLAAASVWIRTHELHKRVLPLGPKGSMKPHSFKVALARLRKTGQLERRGKPRHFEYRATNAAEANGSPGKGR